MGKGTLILPLGVGGGSLQGIQGADGMQGTMGLQGYTGIQGTDGLQGYTGIQGTDGLQGTMGMQGANGSEPSLQTVSLQFTLGDSSVVNYDFYIVPIQ